MAIDDPRVVVIDFGENTSASDILPVLNHNPRLDILLSCKAAKARVLKLQTPLFLEHPISERLDPDCYPEQRLVTNKAADTVWMLCGTDRCIFVAYRPRVSALELGGILQEDCAHNSGYTKGRSADRSKRSKPRRMIKKLAICKEQYEAMLADDDFSIWITEICKWGVEEILVVINGEIGANEPDVVFATPRLTPRAYFATFEQIALIPSRQDGWNRDWWEQWTETLFVSSGDDWGILETELQRSFVNFQVNAAKLLQLYSEGMYFTNSKTSILSNHHT